jgi:hypothetical protein
MDQPEQPISQPTSTTRGRPFARGNPGRPGSRNRRSAVAAALLAGEEADLLRKAIELAKGGDVQMLKFLLNRMLLSEPSHKREYWYRR